jgi:hypothetical protein
LIEILFEAKGWAVNVPPNNSGIVFSGTWKDTDFEPRPFNAINVTDPKNPIILNSLDLRGDIFTMITSPKYPDNLFVNSGDDRGGLIIVGNYSVPDSWFFQSRRGNRKFFYVFVFLHSFITFYLTVPVFGIDIVDTPNVDLAVAAYSGNGFELVDLSQIEFPRLFGFSNYSGADEGIELFLGFHHNW